MGCIRSKPASSGVFFFEEVPRVPLFDRSDDFSHLSSNFQLPLANYERFT